MSTIEHNYLPIKSTEQLNLLVVDDEESILKAVKRSFHRTKYNVYTANSAKEGFKILEQHDFQVVLSDFRMPEIDGGTFVKSIKQLYPNIVSMIFTGFADFAAAVEVMNSGAAYKFLSKPWNNKQLIEEVDLAFEEYHQRNINNYKDELTKHYIKPGRVQFDATFKSHVNRGADFALASIIVSDISLYDQYWEQKGPHDSALESVANIVHACLPQDCELFEVEVDQFLIIIPEHDCDDELPKKLSLLNTALSVSHDKNLATPILNCQLAYAQAPFEGKNIHQLLHSMRNLSELDFRDNQQSYGVSSVIKLDARHLAQKKRKKTIQNSIQQAIDSSQFSLYYQPKVSVATGLVENAEILMRWQHDSLGWVSPLEFITLSELDGQIEKIGSWLIDNSVTQLISLRKQYGNNLKLAINVSPRQLQNDQIVDELSYVLEKTGLNPACLELEVTEGCVIEDMRQTSDILWKLKNLGVSIAIDDFGSGYSSFAYLSKLPVDVLKLDKILIDDIGIDIGVNEMLQSIIGLCRRLHIDVVAEGVESTEQVELLKIFGCHYIQGYVYSKPVTKSEFEKILINQPFKYEGTASDIPAQSSYNI